MASVTHNELDLISARSFVLPSTLIIDVYINPGYQGYNVEEGGEDDTQNTFVNVNNGGLDDPLAAFNKTQDSV